MSEVLTSISLIIPLFALAGSAIAWVTREYRESARVSRTRFFELMQIIDEDGNLATKLAAAYALREYPEDKEFIVRFVDVTLENIHGGAADALRKELLATKSFFFRCGSIDPRGGAIAPPHGGGSARPDWRRAKI